MNHGQSMRRLQSSLFAACLLLLAVAGSWHTHELVAPHAHGPSVDLPTIGAQEESTCLACLLGHHVFTQARSVTFVVLAADPEGPVLLVSEVAQARPRPTDPSRAPPVTL
jgi:hypothetical protein